MAHGGMAAEAASIIGLFLRMAETLTRKISPPPKEGAWRGDGDERQLMRWREAPSLINKLLTLPSSFILIGPLSNGRVAPETAENHRVLRRGAFLFRYHHAARGAAPWRHLLLVLIAARTFQLSIVIVSSITVSVRNER